MVKSLLTLAAAVTLLWLAPVRADADSAGRLELPPLFSDDMVLQRDQATPIWGWATPGEPVTVTLGGKTAKTVAKEAGRWEVRLTPPPAGGPYELTIAASQKRTLRNVLVGDVWVCAGQSNIEFGIGMGVNAQQEIAGANHPAIRLFTLGKTPALHPLERCDGKWLPCTSDTVKRGSWNGFSAVGYFFGRELQPHLKVPIGLIQCAWGGTSAEAWTSRGALAAMGPDFVQALAGLSEVDRLIKAHAYDRGRLIEEWYAKCGIDPAVSTLSFDAAGWKTMHRLPHLWGSGDDPALKGFCGAVWFRKEIDLPAELAGKAAELHLGILDDADATYVNGVKVGEAMDLGVRRYAVPAGVLEAGRNVIASWVVNTEGGGGMGGKAEDFTLNIVGTAPIPLAGDWQYQVQSPLDRMPTRLFAIDRNPNWPSELYNGMIAPLSPLGIRGVIWYQGEANVGRAAQYRRLLPALVSDWRARWGQGDFPFVIVQLANFGPSPSAKPNESAMAELREAQALAAKAMPNVGLVTAVDIGDPNDIHPTNKQEVGRRLALLARAMAYRQTVSFSGPVFRESHAEGGKLRIAFDYAQGLHAKGTPDLRGFAVAGEDRVFHWAEAAIVGDAVVLTSRDVPAPVAARYDWDASPHGNLYNEADLPAFPFRTDDWK